MFLSVFTANRPAILASVVTLVNNNNLVVFHYSYTKLGFAGNTEPQFIMPSCKFVGHFVWITNIM